MTRLCPRLHRPNRGFFTVYIEAYSERHNDDDKGLNTEMNGQETRNMLYSGSRPGIKLTNLTERRDYCQIKISFHISRPNSGTGQAFMKSKTTKSTIIGTSPISERSSGTEKNQQETRKLTSGNRTEEPPCTTLVERGREIISHAHNRVSYPLFPLA